MELHYKEVPRDWQNLFHHIPMLTRFHYIKVLFQTITGVKKIVCYTQVFVIKKFHLT